VWWGNLRERVYLEDAGIEWRIILDGFFRKWDVGMDWIDLNQYWDRWWAFENMTMNLRFP
jgi:hypothetical protein